MNTIDSIDYCIAKEDKHFLKWHDIDSIVKKVHEIDETRKWRMMVTLTYRQEPLQNSFRGINASTVKKVVKYILGLPETTLLLLCYEVHQNRKHYHILVDSTFSTTEIRKIWKHGYVQIELLYCGKAGQNYILKKMNRKTMENFRLYISPNKHSSKYGKPINYKHKVYNFRTY